MRSDHLLGVLFRVLKADALLELERFDDAATVIAEAAESCDGVPLATIAEIERVKGKALARVGRLVAAQLHFERALRILSVVGNVHARADAVADYAGAFHRDDSTVPDAGDRVTDLGSESLVPPVPGRQRGLAEVSASGTGAESYVTPEDAAALFDLTGNSELFAREAYAILEAARCTSRLALVAARSRRRIEVLACRGWTAEQVARQAHHAGAANRIALGASRGRTLFVLVEPSGDVESRCTIVALRKLIGTAQSLETFRQEERSRTSLWPAEPAAAQDEGVYVSAQTLDNLAIARRIAPSMVPVLITGETGTGKEVLARAIHRHSKRHDGPFLPFNCQAVPRDMIDSQLFGHRRGAFTGAHEQFPGVIRTATGGTLFLDEIGEIDPDVQPKLLRFLETGEIHPLGDSHPIKVDVRVIAATNAEIERSVSEGRFREDLYYRLNVVRLHIPPLRERREEIPPLIQQFLQRYAAEEHKGKLRLADETLEYLLLYSWPGNVRQLANEIRRLASLAEADAVTLPDDLSPVVRAARRTIAVPDANDVPGSPRAALSLDLDQPLSQAVAQLERAMIRRAIQSSGGRMELAARTLKISRKGLFLKRHRLGLDGSAVA